MKLTSHKILKHITKNREVSLAEIIPLIDKKFGDYRDYYPLAQLCVSGYIQCAYKQNSELIKDEKLLASILYSKATGEKKVNNFTSIRNEPTPEEEMFNSTIKSEIYFAEAKAKRSDRLYSIAVGILVGICTAFLAVKFGVN